ncbi:MAG: ornithine cyclodeaminase family protein [Proteobacteria bacterium]|nr:ornithine cyclodeaminase family protein [Pseudomonadota bacterium]
MLLLTEADTRELVGPDDALAAVEAGFAAMARGEVVSFPPLVGHGSAATTRFGVKAAVYVARRRPGLKIGSYWPANPAQGRPAHASTTVLLDDDTGQPLAIVSAGYLNALRTAAADAVAMKWLSAPDAGVLALIGGGNQAWFEFEAVRRVRPVREARVWARDARQAQALAARIGATGIEARATALEDAMRGAELVVTATAARAALVASSAVAPGAHISAMGADGVGKQELEVELVARATRFADLPSQSVRLGEFQHAATAGVIDVASVRAIGEVITGDERGRTSADEITVFDSSGVAIQDIAIAWLAIERAGREGRGKVIDFA